MLAGTVAGSSAPLHSLYTRPCCTSCERKSCEASVYYTRRSLTCAAEQATRLEICGSVHLQPRYPDEMCALYCSPSRWCSMFSFVAFAGIDYLSRTFESWDIPGTSSSSSTLSTLRQASACSLFPYLQQRIAFQTADKRRIPRSQAFSSQHIPFSSSVSAACFAAVPGAQIHTAHGSSPCQWS